MTFYNDAFFWLLEPMLFLWIPGSLAIGCSFATIRFHRVISFFEYIPFPIILNNCVIILVVTMMPATAVEHQSSKACTELRSIVGRTPNKKLMRKEVNSLRTFGVRLGFCRAVKRNAILLSYYLITNHIFTVLFAFPEQVVNA